MYVDAVDDDPLGRWELGALPGNEQAQQLRYVVPARNMLKVMNSNGILQICSPVISVLLRVHAVVESCEGRPRNLLLLKLGPKMNWCTASLVGRN